MTASGKRLVGNMLVFGLAGPPIGLIFVLCVIQPSLTSRPMVFHVLADPALLASLSVIAYMFGFIPAIMTGVANASFGHRFGNPVTAALSMTCLGWALSIIAMMAFLIWNTPSVEPAEAIKTLVPLAIYGSCGGAAALCCHLITQNTRISRGSSR